MVKIINIRGCNGAGKTTLVRKLIESETSGAVDILIGKNHTPGHFLPDTQTVVVGPYKPGKATGGMDNVNTTSEAISAVYSAVVGDFVSDPTTAGQAIPANGQPHFVVFEGVLISTVFTTWLDVARDFQISGHSFAWAFLRTPLETCIERVKARRAAKGRPETGFKEELVANKHKSIENLRRKVIAVGDQKVTDLTFGHEFETLMELINA